VQNQLHPITVLAEGQRFGFARPVLSYPTNFWRPRRRIFHLGRFSRRADGAPAVPVEPRGVPFSLPARDRFRCSSSARSNPPGRPRLPAPPEMSSVRSTGKPYVSYSLKASSPETSLHPTRTASSSRSEPAFDGREESHLFRLGPFADVGTAAGQLRVDPTIRSTTTPVSGARVGSRRPSNQACRTARRRMRRTTYPRPSLLGNTPSARRKATARA
jgi:hypothetical protein